MFGDTLVGKSGNVNTAEALAGKVVGIYFSAHWCGPCRGFTPQLAQSYKDLVATGRAFEIIFVSSDRDENAFNEYYGEMPWLALPYADRARKDSLSKKFKVSGIPSFVILDEEGKVITTEGRKAISADPQGAEFPWKPPTLEEALGDEFIKNDGTIVTRASLQGKKLALYFSAHWCPPCRGFTPDLVKLYDTMKASGRDDFEFIFVSSDRDENAFKEYHGEMPWLALPYANRKGKEALSTMFKVEGIPSLVTIDENGFTITTDARGRAGADPTGKEFPWSPKPITDLSEGPGAINEHPALIMLMENVNETKQQEYEAMMQPLADAVFAAKATPDADPSMIFFTSKKKGDSIAGQLRQMTNLGNAEDDNCQMVLLDIGAGGKFYRFPGSDVTKESIANFVEFYKAGSLEQQQLSR